MGSEMCIRDSNLTNKGVSGASTSYIIDELGETGELTDLGNGIYRLDISTENKPVGRYSVVVHIKKSKYVEIPCVVFIDIIKRPTNFTSITANNIQIEQGSKITLKFKLSDALNGAALNFTLNYSWQFGSGQLKYIGNGTYELEISSENIPRGTYTIEISCITDNWTVESKTVVVTITWVKIFGLEWPFFVAIVGAIAAFVGGLTTYYLVRKARIPEIVRKIDATISGIKSGKKELDVPITKSKSMIYFDRYKKLWALLNLKPPVIESKYLVEYVYDIINKVKSIRMTLPEVEKLVNKLIANGILKVVEEEGKTYYTTA